MSLQQYNPRDFPGRAGRELLVRTNCFDLKISNPTLIGEVLVLATQSHDGTISTLPHNKIFNEFKNAYKNILNDYEVIEGYNTVDGITVYIVPPFKGDFPPRNRVVARNHGYVSVDDWKSFDNQFKMFLKRTMLQSCRRQFAAHNFQLMKRGIFSFNMDDHRLGMQPLNRVLDIIRGFRIGFETDVPYSTSNESRNMVSINLTHGVTARANVPLFNCFLELCDHGLPDRMTPEDCNNLMLSPYAQHVLNDLFFNVQVYIRHEKERKKNKYYRLVEICPTSANRTGIQGGRTVQHWYEEKYNIRLKYPSLNVVRLKARKDFFILVPMEHVILSDKPQRVAQKAVDAMFELRNQLKEVTAVTPVPRWQYIDNMAGMLHANLMDAPQANILKKLGITLDDRPIEVEARVLDIPSDTYHRTPGVLAQPCDKIPVECIVVDFRPNYGEDIERDIRILMDKLYGRMNIYRKKRPLKWFQLDRYQPKNGIDEVVDWHLNEKPRFPKSKFLYLVIIDDRDKGSDIHQLVKQSFDYNGMPSQVITYGVLHGVLPPRRDLVDETVEDRTFNLALKINSKLGGINCMPDQAHKLWEEYINDRQLMMFIGIDTRLSPGEKSTNGLVGIMVSTDSTGVKYTAHAKTTNGKTRYCGNYENILFKAFDSFVDFDDRPAFPDNILVFRAGLNDYEVRCGEADLEIKHLKCIIHDYVSTNGIRHTPKLTYISYNRAHNVRFYNPEFDSRYDSRLKDYSLEGVKANCPPGTVIDRDITNPSSFYFISHESFMGTVKPAKYYIRHDEIGFKVDNLLAIIYQLCRLNPQTKRSYRRPVPLGLASKLLARVVELKPTIFDERFDDDFYIHEEFKNVNFFI